jgi:hypothetical protein
VARNVLLLVPAGLALGASRPAHTFAGVATVTSAALIGLVGTTLLRLRLQIGPLVTTPIVAPAPAASAMPGRS